jgi:hypothetical protein
LLVVSALLHGATAGIGTAASSGLLTPEDVIRTLVRANAEKDLHTMSKLMAHDPDTISYTVDGRKYVGWNDLSVDLRSEFEVVTKLEIPIHELKVWSRGETAWFAMELDYVRYIHSGIAESRSVIPLRETGVLEKRDGNWILVAWHESFRQPQLSSMAATQSSGTQIRPIDDRAIESGTNLSGEWEIQEEDKSYNAVLDANGNGSYTWQGGRITTTKFADRKWQGTWKQTGNDREGGFDVLLSEDGTQAKGVWWYTRVGDKNNIPPRQWGGPYTWKRLTPLPTSPATLQGKD